jgi:hypothetical protein
MAKKSLSFPHNAELEALRARVLRRREYLDLLETELANTRAVVQEFTSLYNTRITPLEQERARLSKLLDDITADQAPPASGWRGRGRGPVSGGAYGSEEGPEQEPDPDRIGRVPRKKKPAEKDPDYERKIRDLFRKLAKQYHPDLVGNEDQKKRNEEIMAEINNAYMAKDLEALLALEKTRSNPTGLPTSPEAELAHLTLELRQLDAMVFDIEQTIRELDLSPAMQMRSDTRDDRDILGELEAEFRTRISELQEQLLGLGVEINEAQK